MQVFHRQVSVAEPSFESYTGGGLCIAYEETTVRYFILSYVFIFYSSN